MEYKSFDLEVKSLNTEEGVLEGYASVFGNVDLQGDIVERGAFTKTLLERGDHISLCWQHEAKLPIGKPLVIREDGHGLYLKAKISDTQLGRDALTLLRDKVIQTMSIGYDTIKDDWAYFDVEGKEVSNPKGKGSKRVRKLQELRLYEVSLVTVAANPKAQVLSVKDNTEPSDKLAEEEAEPSEKDTHLTKRRELMQGLLDELMKG